MLSLFDALSHKLTIQLSPDPDGEDDDDLAELDDGDLHETNKIEPDTTEFVAQATTDQDQISKPQDCNGSVVQQEPFSQLASNTKQPQAHTDSGNEANPDIATISDNAADSHQLDNLSTHAQTDANASLSHALVSPCKSTKQPPGTRQTDLVPDHAVVRLIERADRSAGRLVNLLSTHFPLSFRDEARFDGRRVKLLKRAQIFVADLWAALNARGLGEFSDIDHLTMFPGTSFACTAGGYVHAT